MIQIDVSVGSTACDCSSDPPVKAVHHFEVCAQVFLGEVVQHASVYQALHEVAAVLRQAQAGQPLVPYPLVVHISVRKSLRATKGHSFFSVVRNSTVFLDKLSIHSSAKVSRVKDKIN